MVYISLYFDNFYEICVEQLLIYLVYKLKLLLSKLIKNVDFSIFKKYE